MKKGVPMKDPQQLLDKEIRLLCEGRVENPSAKRLTLFETLIAAGADPAAMTFPVSRGGGNTSALIIAAARGWDGVVGIFLRRAGLNVDAVDLDGEHALLAALKKGQKASAALLLGRSKVWKADASGPSCLSVAIRRGLASEARSIIERMGDGERQRELEEMIERRLSEARSMGREELETQMIGLLRSKVEEVAVAGATGGTAKGALGRAAKPARL